MLNNCTDFHGLYGATINDKTATKNNIFFVKTMLENSLATQQNVLNLKNSRPCSRETRPFTAYSTIKNPVFERTSEGYHEFDDRKFETLTQNNIVL